MDILFFFRFFELMSSVYDKRIKYLMNFLGLRLKLRIIVSESIG